MDSLLDDLVQCFPETAMELPKGGSLAAPSVLGNYGFTFVNRQTTFQASYLSTVLPNGMEKTASR